MEYQDQPYKEVADQVGVHTQANQQTLVQSQTRQLQYQMEEAEKNLAEAQLDCEETLTRINHLLKQDRLIIQDGVFDWQPIQDKKKRVLTDEGVERIMQVMQSYINKETLLSNFDEDTIARRMLEFSLAFSGLIFQKYEIFFRTPTLEECEELLQFRIDEKVKIKQMSCKFASSVFDEKKIRRDILDEMESRLEVEIKKIKQEQTKLNLREFEMMFTQMKALVEATHNRAWKGEERGSLRRHFNISEVIGGRATMPEKKGGLFGWGKN
jgi:hypothetical protein